MHYVGIWFDSVANYFDDFGELIFLLFTCMSFKPNTCPWYEAVSKRWIWIILTAWKCSQSMKIQHTFCHSHNKALLYRYRYSMVFDSNDTRRTNTYTRSTANHIKMLSCIEPNDRIECFGKKIANLFRYHFAFISYIRKYCKCLFWKCIQIYKHTQTYNYPYAKATDFFLLHLVCSLLSLFATFFSVCIRIRMLRFGAVAWFINDCPFFSSHASLLLSCMC